MRGKQSPDDCKSVLTTGKYYLRSRSCRSQICTSNAEAAGRTPQTRLRVVDINRTGIARGIAVNINERCGGSESRHARSATKHDLGAGSCRGEICASNSEATGARIPQTRASVVDIHRVEVRTAGDVAAERMVRATSLGTSTYVPPAKTILVPAPAAARLPRATLRL